MWQEGVLYVPLRSMEKMNGMRKAVLLSLSAVFLVFLSACTAGSEVVEEVEDEYFTQLPVVAEKKKQSDVESLELKRKLMETSLAIRAGEECVVKTFGELGIVIHDEERFFEMYKDVLAGEVSGPIRGIEINSYSVRCMIEELAEIYNRAVVEPSLLGIQDGELLWEEGVPGRSVSIECTLSMVKSAVNGFWGKDITLEAVALGCAPQFDVEALSSCKDILGECVVPCDFDTASGKNALRASELLHGSVLYPGEALSLKTVLEPFNEENGYVGSTGFIDGYVVDSIGGGVCRVVTALYGAVLKSELTVLERHCHTKQVSYAPVSMDATVSSEKDLVFRNDTDFPIVITATQRDEGICVALVGIKTDILNKSRVEFVAQITDVVLQGADEVIISESLPYMEYRVIVPGAPGCRAVLYKYMYDAEGELVDAELVNESFYLPRSSLVLAGKYYE